MAAAAAGVFEQKVICVSGSFLTTLGFIADGVPCGCLACFDQGGIVNIKIVSVQVSSHGGGSPPGCSTATRNEQFRMAGA
jgi:hypothetical protein